MNNQKEKLAELIKRCSSSNATSVVKIAEQKKNYDFYYISAGAGSGKTHWAIEKCTYFNTLGINVVIIVPTIQLAESFKDRSNGLIVPIHSDNTETNVISKITNIFIEQAEIHADPISIVITEQAFALTNFKFRNDNWILIKDEATEPMTIHSIPCTDSKHLIENWIKFKKITEVESKLSRLNLTVQCPQTTDDQDGVLQAIYKLKNLLENPLVEILADTEKLIWEKPELRYSIFAK